MIGLFLIKYLAAWVGCSVAACCLYRVGYRIVYGVWP